MVEYRQTGNEAACRAHLQRQVQGDPSLQESSLQHQLAQWIRGSALSTQKAAGYRGSSCAFRYLPTDFRQEVQRRRLTSWPPSIILTFWMLRFQRRRVAFFDQGRLFPYIGVLGQ